MIGDILQPTHLVFILVVALLVLGPKRLPEAGRAVGGAIRDFRSAMSGEHDQLTEVPTQAPAPPPPTAVAVAPAVEPAQATTEPAQTSVDPFQAPPEPAQTTVEPAQTTVEPAQATTEPAQTQTDQPQQIAPAEQTETVHPTV
jgi:sec-independent protein translocase protein TatA